MFWRPITDWLKSANCITHNPPLILAGNLSLSLSLISGVNKKSNSDCVFDRNVWSAEWVCSPDHTSVRPPSCCQRDTCNMSLFTRTRGTWLHSMHLYIREHIIIIWPTSSSRKYFNRMGQLGNVFLLSFFSWSQAVNEERRLHLKDIMSV